jgi:hypothetical protein
MTRKEWPGKDVRMSNEPGEALEVLRGIWSAQGQGREELDEACGHHGHGKACKNMANVGFGDTDEDLRAAWRGRLEREGKLRAGSSLADLVLRPSGPR